MLLVPSTSLELFSQLVRELEGKLIFPLPRRKTWHLKLVWRGPKLLGRYCHKSTVATCTVGFVFISKSQSFVVVGVSKQGIRERIWDYMESRDLADFPRPVHHRIPNFKVRRCSWGC